MDSSKKSNKIREIVRLQQILKKWKKIANASKNNANNNNTTIPLICSSNPATTNVTGTNTSSTSANNSGGGGGSKSIKFLKKTLSFTESTLMMSDVVPKGYLAVCVGKELKRFVIPMEYLGHQAFGILLREAEEEFGFQQEGVLKIPCEVSVFEKILKMMEQKRSAADVFFVLHEFAGFGAGADHKENNMLMGCYSSPDHNNCELTPSHHAQLCR